MLPSTPLAVASFASTALALASFNPVSNGPSYRVGIPSSSSISSAAPGPLYFSLTAPSTYQWVGLGIGTQMAGATIFVMYPDGQGNVTLSARAGTGEVQPRADSNTLAGVELLAGSGITDGVMTANVRCTTCKLLSDANSKSSPWIAAWVNSKSPQGSTSQSFNIPQHSDDDHRQFTFDLSAASLSTDVNPFVAASTASSGSGSGSGSGTSPSASGTSSGASPSSTGQNSTPPSGAGSSSSGSSSSSSSSSPGSKLQTYDKVHGIIMAATLVLLFPLGAIIMRLAGSVWLHAAIQMFGLVALLAGFGVGVWLAQQKDYLFKSTGTAHTIFGTVITGLFLLQPVLGLLHHSSYKRTGSRGLFSALHTWYGRALIVGGVVNGGLGIKLAGNVGRNWKIVYMVVAAVMAVAYVVAVLARRKGGRDGRPARDARMGGGKRWGKRERDASS